MRNNNCTCYINISLLNTINMSLIPKILIMQVQNTVPLGNMRHFIMIMTFTCMFPHVKQLCAL